MQLTDYFATFNLFNSSVFIFAFLVFDAIGVNLAHFLKPSDYLRTVYWIWGLGIFIFIWFLLHFFLPFWPVYVWISLIIFGLVSLPVYLKNRGPLTLIKALIHFPYPLLVIPLIFKPFYFLLNAPPFYFDEMAYQFYSPAQLTLETHWPFWPVTGPPSLYHMMPKTLNTAFIIMFSITKTYATARLLHFLLVFSSYYAIVSYIWKKVGRLPALILTFLMPFLTASTFLAASTWGYVDAGAAVLSILFLIATVDFVNKPNKYRLFVAAIFFGLAISIKNTVVAFLGSLLAVSVFLFLIIYYRRIRKIIMNKESIIILFSGLIIFLLFGGYWYLKNFLISGNPIYPFVFPCWYGWPCGTARGFFQAWAVAIGKEHFFLIKNILFQESNLMFYLTIFSVVLGFFAGLITRNKIVKYLIFTIVWSIILEIIISKNVTGFELRYYYHWFLLIPVLLVFPFVIFSRLKSNSKLVLSIYIFYSIAFVYIAGNVVWKNFRRIYEGDFVPGYIRNYAMHRIGLSDWIDYYFPKMNDFIKWCGKKGPMQDVTVLDPSLIWSSYEGMMRVFMVNCSITGNTSRYVISETRCTPNQPYPGSNDPSVQTHNELNQKLICNSKEIFKNLYLYSRDIK
jgi:hypothetical protein